MARCKQCGKGGLFFKVNENGICKDCQIQQLDNSYKELSNTHKELNQLIDEIGARDTLAAKKKTNEYIERYEELIKKCNNETGHLNSLEEEIKNKRKEILVIDDILELESFALYLPKFKFLTSDKYKNRLDSIREKQKALIKNDGAVIGGFGWTVNGKAAEGKKMIRDMKKLLLRSFNNECDYCVDNVKFNNITANETRINKSFETINKLGTIMQISISDEYRKLKFDELYLAYEYQEKKQEEKEEQKRAREELREQKKLEQEIREARERIAKESKHYTAFVNDIQVKISKVKDNDELEALKQKLSEYEQKLEELKKEESIVDYREKNAKAGYVYVISNIGAFGEQVFKIGMTRRLEPMERVDELGDASVPFRFDVHAMVFSDNAPDLEAKLHRHFYTNRINKINDRKEFFKANIDEIEKVLRENYKEGIVDFIKEAPAQQYRESLLMK
jgi:hypothetical protein